MIRGAAAACALCVLPLTAAPGAAHESDPGVVAVIDAVVPPLPPGVTVQVATSVAAQLVVANPTDVPLDVLDDAGAAYIRISAAGVAADLDSPAWRASNAPSGRVGPATSRPQQRPLVSVSRDSSWGWFDHRVHPGRAFVPERVRARRIRVELDRWEVSLRYGGERVTVRGHVEFRPVLGRLVTAVTSRPLPAGLTVTTVDGRVPAVFVRNDAAEPVVVLDADGGRYASIGPDGVLVMDRSRVHLEDQRIKGRDLSFEPRTGEGIRVSTAASYTWFDPRIRVPEEEVPDAVQRAGAPTVLSRWVIPLAVGDERIDVSGTTTWMPLTEAERAVSAVPDDPYRPGPLTILAVPAVGLLGLVFLRRRRTYHRADGKA